MSFILSAQRDGPYPAVNEAFARYRDYLASIGDVLPAGARALATSTWYFDASNHQSPHDGWLESILIGEAGESFGAQQRAVSIRVRLLAAYHDGHIEFRYRDVVRYRLHFTPPFDAAPWGHRDWRYDEFRLSKHGGIEHEIEWSGPTNTGTWLIEAADVEYRWFPLADA